MPGNHTSRVALVTGGAGKFGRQIVEALAEAGAQTVMASRDTNQLAKTTEAFASRGLNVQARPLDQGDEASIDAISRAAGFQFFAAPQGFDHLSQTTIVDADGMVYRQVYGQDFDVQQFVEPLKELVFDTPRDAGVIQHWVDTFKLFCTVYDPNTGRYEFDYSIFLTIVIGVLCLGAILAFIVYEWRRAA